MSQTTKNYHDQGGDSWVVGGKLTILPGATVEGLPTSGGGQLPFMPQSTATTVSVLREEYNRLLSALKEAGLMASAAPAAPVPAPATPEPPADDQAE